MIRTMNTFLLFFALLLFCSPEGADAKPYRGAELRTKETYTYGRFEVRMQSVQVSGMLSSFFTYHEISSLDDWNEIDIEILGRYADRVQFNTITPGQTNHVFDQEVPFNPHEGFHIYAMEWTPDYVAWHVDSVEIYRQTEPHIQTLNRSQKLMMNIWPPVYADWVGPLDAGKLPAHAFYDWVKYYAYTPRQKEIFTLKWVDNFDSWNQTRWSKGTHTWDGNECDFITENCTFQDGYMILSLTQPENTGYHEGTVPETDTDPPYVIQARFYDGNLQVLFSETVDPVTARSASNYQIPGLTVSGADLLGDGRTVRLYVTAPDSGVSYELTVRNISDRSENRNTLTGQRVIAKPSLHFPLYINPGGFYTNPYLEDRIWSSGESYGRDGGTIFRKRTGYEFSNTDEDEIYRSEVRGISLFHIRVPNGCYRVTLMLAETEFESPDMRVMNVYAEGEKRVSGLDIFAEAGFETALEVVLGDIDVSDQLLDLYFEAEKGATSLRGLRIERVPSSLPTGNITPRNFEFRQYPNPFNAATTLSYSVDQDQAAPVHIELSVYDTLGRQVEVLFNGLRNPGRYEVRWDAGGFGSGLYFCVLKRKGYPAAVQKAVLIR